ncbi:MAG: acyl-CoA synthetase [Candidatus Binatia bacterium]|nr:acyl-CoA synthetase [Candidatus Binatia bacterium]
MNKHFNIADLFEQVADAVPEREALVCGGDRLSYAALDTRANRLAHYLSDKGVGPGQHVGLYLYNCNEYLEAMMACFKIRAVPINVNYRYVQEELQYVFQNADLVACVHQKEFVPHIEEIRSELGTLQTLVYVDDESDADPSSLGSVGYEEAIAQASPERGFGERADDDFFVLYTGGTTGMPKGVMWPHKGLFFAALGGAGHFHPDGPIKAPDEIASHVFQGEMAGMALAPLMHGACWWYACIMLLGGAKLVLNHHRSLVGDQVWDIVQAEKVNALSIVGDAMAIPLLDSLASSPDKWDLSSVFSVGSGGAVFSDSKQEQFRKYFPNVRITNAFGSSESGQMGMDSGQKKTAAGLGNVVRSDFMDVIIDEDGESRRHAAPGETGIFSRSGHIPVGYYNDPEKTARTFVEVEGRVWLLTGDAAKLEKDGESITVFGRGSNCINSGGEKIFPEEVEQALKRHPQIFDALVVGTPSDRWGEQVTAVVSLRGDAAVTVASAQDEARKHVSGYKIPRAVHVVSEVPRAPSGKPDYKTAKELALSGDHAVS